jgi:hypothetical protein
MWKKLVITAIVIGAGVLALSAAPLLAADQPTLATPTCVVCCEDGGLCQALADLADLRATVDELVQEAGIATSLDSKLDVARAAVLASKITPAVDQLDAFGNEVAGLEDAAKLSEPVSNALKAKNDELKTIVNNIR